MMIISCCTNITIVFDQKQHQIMMIAISTFHTNANEK